MGKRFEPFGSGVNELKQLKTRLNMLKYWIHKQEYELEHSLFNCAETEPAIKDMLKGVLKRLE